jgi:hypothetical protein
LAKFAPPISSFDEWLFLLSRTIQDNNWKNLHPRLQTDISYLRRLKDVIDFINEFPIPSLEIESEKYQAYRLIKASIDESPKLFKEFVERFSIDMCVNETATIGDIKVLWNLFHRGVLFKEFEEGNCKDWRVMDVTQKALKLWQNNPRVNIEKAFGGVRKKKVNPYLTPDWAKRMLKDIIDKDCTQEKAISNEQDYANKHKLPVHHEDWYESEFRKRYKWTALNDYLFERVEQGKPEMSEQSIHRIGTIFEEIKLPKKLEVFVDLKKETHLKIH